MSPPRRTSLSAARTFSQAPSGKRRKTAAGTSLPDLHAILGHFDYALAIISVAQIAIAASEQLAQEECALRQGIAALNLVYNELDEAVMWLAVPSSHPK